MHSSFRSQKLPFHIQVFLDEDEYAEGQLIWDDGDATDTYEKGLYSMWLFKSESSQFLSENVRKLSRLEIPALDSLTVAGIKNNVSKVFVNARPAKFTWSKNVLKLSGLNLDMTRNLKINWQ